MSFLVFFQCFKYFTPLSFSLYGLWWEVCCIFYSCSYIDKMLLSFDFFQRFFSLSLVFCSLNMLCLSVNLIYPAWCSLSFFICRLISAINFRKFLSIITSNISFPLYFWYFNYAYVIPFKIIPKSLNVLFFFKFSFLFTFSWKVPIYLSPGSLILSSAFFKLLMSPSHT